MTMIHVGKGGRDPTARIVSLDLLLYDSSVMTFTRLPEEPRGEGRENGEGVADRA